MTVSVWVAALPPMPGTTGMNIASATTRAMVVSEQADDRGARNAVARLTSSHGNRLRSDSLAGVNTRSSAGDAGEPIDVLGRLVLDDVDHVVDGDDADQLVLFVNDRDREQVVGGHQPRDFFLIRVGAHADESVVMIRLSGVAGDTSSRRRSETTPTR